MLNFNKGLGAARLRIGDSEVNTPLRKLVPRGIQYSIIDQPKTRDIGLSHAWYAQPTYLLFELLSTGRSLSIDLPVPWYET